MPQRDPHIDKLIQDLKTKKFREGEAKGLTQTYGEEITKQLTPLFSSLSKEVTFAVKDAFKNLKVDVPKSEIPQVNMPEFPAIPPFPEMQAPIVNVPAPIVNIPAPIVNVSPSEVHFPSEMSLKNGDKPFPVTLQDVNGKPFQFPVGGGSSGPGFPMRVLDESTNALRVTGSFSVTSSNASTQLIDSSLNAVGTATNPLNVAIASGAASSTKAQIGNSDGDFTQANPLPVVFSSSGSTASALIDSSGIQYSGSNPFPVTFSAAASQNVGLISVTNVQSALNSSTAILGIGGEFTGLPELVRDYAAVQVYIIADVASSTNGLMVQQSSDGSNWDVTDTYTIPAATGKTFSFQPASMYYRLFYANGATGQASFRLSTVHHFFPVKSSSQRSQDAYTNETDLEQIWAFGSMYDAAGDTWSRMRSGDGVSTGALRVTQAADVVTSVNIVSTITQTVQQVSGAVDSVVVNSGTITAVTGITNSVAVVALDRDGNPLTTGPIGVGDGATALRVLLAGDVVGSVYVQNPVDNGDSATALRVVHAGNAIASVNVVSSVALTVTSITNSVATVLTDSTGVAYSGSNPVPTTATISLPAGPGDGATATRFIQAGDTVSSTNILQINGNTPATGLNETTAGVLRVTIMTDTAQSANVTAFNGNAPATGLNETTAGVLRTITMSDTVSSVYANNPFGQGDVATALRVVQAGNVASSVMSAATGLNETTVDVLRVVTMSDTSSSVQSKVIARTTNPTALADAASGFQSADKLGRALSRPIQVRDLIKTAYVSITSGTETTLLTASAGTFADLIMITATNNSTAATQLDIRATTAGNIIHTMYLPASTGPVGFSPSVPWPQDSTGNSWTIDMPDQTGTTVYVSALFSQEL